MRVERCLVNKEHCPYCGGHDTLMLHSSAALVRGDSHWCGSCHRTFTEDMLRQPVDAAFRLSGRELAIIGAALRRCIGWDDPRELQRFVNIAAEHVRDGWSEAEMDAVLENLSGQWLKEK